LILTTAGCRPPWIIRAKRCQRVVSLNQSTGIATPGYEDIPGVALATNAVYVNGGLANSEV
jgi:hypothetical protein